MAKDCSLVGQMISLGPWGYETGNEWIYIPKQGGIKQIIIRCGGIIDSIMFKGGGVSSTKFGGDGGDRTFKIDIDFPSEYLTGISGTYGSFWTFGHNVCSLNFHTNKKKYGPFGSGNGTAFSVNANGGVITGFHGSYGRYLESIGIHIMPADSFLARPGFLLPSRSAGPKGGYGGREWDDGIFSAIYKITVIVGPETGVVSAFQTCYRKSDGKYSSSPYYGKHAWFGIRGDSSNSIIFGEGEYLIGVEGFCGPVKGVDVITSLTFITNKAKYGPWGAEIGTFFTFMNAADCNRKVVGFHGRSSDYLNAIGLHTEYF